MKQTTRTRVILASGLGVLGVAAAVFIGTTSGGVAFSPAILAGMGTSASFATPVPEVDEPAAASGGPETAVLAGGCFWGVQGVFQHVKGVTEAESGYAGGDQATANYDTVSTGSTGHAESVRITYDPTQVTFGQLLRIYFSVVQDPTELDRQGPDEGTQYRSEIFAENATQQHVAESYVGQLTRAAVFPAPIVTTVGPKTGFYPAESYHQNFLNSNPSYPYIAYNDMPKLNDLKRLFPDVYRDQPVLVPVSAGSATMTVAVAVAVAAGAGAGESGCGDRTTGAGVRGFSAIGRTPGEPFPSSGSSRWSAAFSHATSRSGDGLRQVRRCMTKVMINAVRPTISERTSVLSATVSGSTPAAFAEMPGATLMM
jgi:peptide-methionine (S)-S-oxide reductase